MSKKRGNWSMRLPLSVALDRSKATVERLWQSVCKVFRSIAARDQCDRPTVVISTDVGYPIPTDTPGQQLIEFEDFAKALNIGDRIRVLCDDGLVVAEKISQTKFQLIHCQQMSELVH